MYTDCQLKDFKLNSDLMKSMILRVCFVFKDCSNSPPAEWSARVQKKEPGTVVSLLLPEKTCGYLNLRECRCRQ